MAPTPIPGSNGNWEVEVTPGLTYTHQDGRQEKGSDKIKIAYKPNPGSCSDIRIVQTVRWEAYDEDGELVTKKIKEMYKSDSKNKFKFREDDEIRYGSLFIAIDYMECSSEPYFNGDSTGVHDSSADATDPNTDPTIIIDIPQMDFENIKDEITRIEKHFETCAICVDDGEILDCITWKSVSTRDPIDGGTIIFNPTSSPNSSGAFDLALKRFFQTHTETDSSGKTFWKCVQTNKKGTSSDDGKDLPPVSDPFKKKWGFLNTYRLINLDFNLVGTGNLMDNPIELSNIATQNPLNSAIKFTWFGSQDKPIGSVVLSGFPKISTSDISPFIFEDINYRNDNLPIQIVNVTSELILSLLSDLCKIGKEIDETSGRIMVTMMTNLGLEKPFAFNRILSREELNKVFEQTEFSKENPEVIRLIHYLMLNMGTTEKIY